MKTRKVFWGVFFILAAVYVIVSKLSILPDIGVFRILLTVGSIWILLEGIRYLNFYGILFPIAFICIIYDKQLGITALTPWTVLGAALLGSIGLSILFRSRKKNWKTGFDWDGRFGAAATEQYHGDHVKCENNFGSAIRYINSDNFCNAELENNFGSLTVYFDNAVIQSPSAYVSVECNFGETNLYIPKEWKVENCMERAFGSVSEKGKPLGSSNTVLYIRGSANFGAIHIYYV